MISRTRCVTLALLIVAIFLAGCSAGSATEVEPASPPTTVASPTASATLRPLPTVTSKVLPATPSPATATPAAEPYRFLADFSATGSWGTGSSEELLGVIEEGVYRMHVFAESGLYWATSDELFGRGAYELFAIQTGGTLDNGYGMLFMVDDVRDDFYLFEIGGDGYVWIGSCENGCKDSATPLVGEGWFESSAVHSGWNVENKLRVEAQDQQALFYVNDTLVGTVAGFTPREGDIGVFIETLGEGDVTVEFDNFSYVGSGADAVAVGYPVTAAAPLSIVPHWASGETRTLEITKWRYWGGTKPTTMAVTPVEITVIEAGDDGYVLRWDIGSPKTVGVQAEDGYMLRWNLDNPEAAGSIPAIDPATSVLLALAASLDPVYEVDAAGMFIRLGNWKDIQATMEQVLEQFLAQMAQDEFSEEELQAMRDMLDSMLNSRENLEMFVLSEVLWYHHVFGWRFDPEAPLEYEDALPNPYGGEPIPCVARFEPPVVRGNLLEISWSQTPDPEVAWQSLLRALTDLDSSFGGEPLTNEDLPSPFVIEDTAHIVVDLATGWIQTAEFSRKIVIETSERIDWTQIVDTTASAK